jgi:F-type H+-transporting ATPase subunit b
MTITTGRSRPLLVTVACAFGLWLGFVSGYSSAQEQPPAQSAQTSSQTSPAQATQPTGQASENIHRLGVGGELAKEERIAEGEEQEEHSDLKHSAMVQKLAKLTGMSVHGAHLFALCLNFAIIVFLFYWLGRKSLPALFRARNDSIRKALEEARKASDDANRRLAQIESRLREMDTEIGKMQASAEKDAEGEEQRIKQAAEDEMRKLEEAAKHEIAAAAKEARRELSAHTADLAIALARKQINVDSNTDRVLVRDFAAKLTNNPSQGNGGKDGH